MSPHIFEFQSAGHNWQSKRLDPFQQMAVVKRILPLVSGLVPLMMSASQEGLSPDAALTALQEHFPALAEGVSSLKDDDLRWLMETCLATLKIQDESADGKYMPFWNKSTKLPMYDDLADLAVYLPVTIQVIKENLTPFFRTWVTNRSTQTNEAKE